MALADIVVDAIMLAGAVVPEGDRIGPPGKAALQLGQLGLVEQYPQQLIAFRRRDADDMPGEDRVDVDRLLAGLRSEEHTSELQSQFHLVCRLLLEKNKFHQFAGAG